MSWLKGDSIVFDQDLDPVADCISPYSHLDMDLYTYLEAAMNESLYLLMDIMQSVVEYV